MWYEGKWEKQINNNFSIVIIQGKTKQTGHIFMHWNALGNGNSTK